MPHIQGKDRSQMVLIPTCLDDLIGEDSPVRLIDAFVDALDLESHGFANTVPGDEGAPSYTPGLLLKIYMYGYLNSLRTSRKLMKACTVNIELMWLTGQLTPSHTTISNFRRDHPRALKEVFRSLNRLLNGEGLFGRETVAVDGAKFAAQNSKKNNFNQKKIDRALEYHDRKMEQYLAALDRNDGDDQTWERLHRSTAQYLRHKELGEQLGRAAEKGETQVSTTDPDARALPRHMNIVEVGYNVQAATDDKNCLVAHFEVTNKKDDHALSGMAEKAKMELGLREDENLNALADKGYDTGPELKKCADANITTYVAPKQNRPKRDTGRFRKQDFTYNGDDDTYTCPWNEVLTANGTWYEKKARNGGQSPYRFKRYTITYPTCDACPYRDQCLNRGSVRNRHGRYIERSEFEQYSEANRERVEGNRELYRKRQQIVEHPFGTIKRHWGYTFTLLKTMAKVEGEFALIFTAYNLRRAVTILGTPVLIQKLKGLKNALKGLYLSEIWTRRHTERHVPGKIFFGNMKTVPALAA